MLDDRCDKVLSALCLAGVHHAAQGVVIRFGAARGEAYLAGVGVDDGGHVAPCLFDGDGGVSAQLIQRGGVAVALAVIGQHFISDTRVDPCRRRVIGVNKHLVHLFYIRSFDLCRARAAGGILFNKQYTPFKWTMQGVIANILYPRGRGSMRGAFPTDLSVGAPFN